MCFCTVCYTMAISLTPTTNSDLQILVPQEVYDLMDLYPQTPQRRPSVQYIPMPSWGGDRPPSSSRD
ncbi:MAG: hypothetical protein PVI07_10365 [Anaerolineae bacterium]